MKDRIPSACRTLCASLLALLAGCASTEEIMRTNADPLEGYNRTMFAFNDTIDRAVLKPVAQGYDAVVPEPVNVSISNFFNNLDDVIVIVNDILQLKADHAIRNTSRLVFNTTFGVLGFFDVAGTYMDLPKHNEDFGQTLGYWGIGEGYYLVLPLLGPSTTRDVWGVPADAYVNPVTYVNPARDRLLLNALNIVDVRAGLLRTERAFDASAQIDPYAFQREAYLQRRRSLVYDGNPPRPDFDFDDE